MQCERQKRRKCDSKKNLRNSVPVLFAVRKWLWNAGRSAGVSIKVNGETREKLGQSAKRSAAVRGQAGRGASVAGRRRPGAAEQNVGIFCLPGFVADRGPIRFSSGSLPRFFPHVRDPPSTLKARSKKVVCFLLAVGPTAKSWYSFSKT